MISVPGLDVKRIAAVLVAVPPAHPEQAIGALTSGEPVWDSPRPCAPRTDPREEGRA